MSTRNRISQAWYIPSVAFRLEPVPLIRPTHNPSQGHAHVSCIPLELERNRRILAGLGVGGLAAALAARRTLANLQGFLIRGSQDGTYHAGGSARVDGGPSRDPRENTRVGTTLALPVSWNHSVKLYGSTGVLARTGSNFDQVGIAWRYRFDGGL